MMLIPVSLPAALFEYARPQSRPSFTDKIPAEIRLKSSATSSNAAASTSGQSIAGQWKNFKGKRHQIVKEAMH